MKVEQRGFKTTDDPEAVLSLLSSEQSQHVLHIYLVCLESGQDGSRRE